MAPGGCRWWSAAMPGHSTPLSYQPPYFISLPILSAAGAYATAAGAGGERAGRGHRTPGESPQPNPSQEQRCRQKGFSHPLKERLEAPGSRAAVFSLKRTSSNPQPAGQEPRLRLGVTPKFTHPPRHTPHLPWRCRYPEPDGSSRAESSSLAGLRSGRALSDFGMKKKPRRCQAGPAALRPGSGVRAAPPDPPPPPRAARGARPAGTHL